MKHDHRLDGIRGLAVLLVIFHHALQNIPIRNPVDFVVLNFAGVCWFGVDLFFVLSGFLITGILLRHRERPFYFKNFYARRILRIFPLYFALLPAILILAAHYGGGWQTDTWFDALYLTNVHNAIYGWPSRAAAHLWSLSVEEQFYIVWPFLIYAIPARFTIAFLLSTAAAVIGTRAIVSEHVTATAVYNLFHWDGLLLGALLATLDFRRVSLPRPLLWTALLGAVTLLVYPPQIAIGLDWQHWRGTQTVSYALIALAGAALIAITRKAAPTAPLSRIFSTPLMTAFGRYSYSIYLVHYPLDTWLRIVHLHPGVEGTWSAISPLPSLVYAVALAALSFGFSQITWRLIESPCLALKRRFEYA